MRGGECEGMRVSRGCLRMRYINAALHCTAPLQETRKFLLIEIFPVGHSLGCAASLQLAADKELSEGVFCVYVYVHARVCI